jgi:hypothetical protein
MFHRGRERESQAMNRAAQHYQVFETAFGFCAIAWSDSGVTRFLLPTKSAEAADRLMQGGVGDPARRARPTGAPSAASAVNDVNDPRLQRARRRGEGRKGRRLSI